MADESTSLEATKVDKELLYAHYYREEKDKYNQQPIRNYCKFPFPESYSDEALQNMEIWRQWTIEDLNCLWAQIDGFSRVAYYYLYFNYEIQRQFKDKFLSQFEDNYEYSDENYHRLRRWDNTRITREGKLIAVNSQYDRGEYTDDEEGIMNALYRGDGDLFGL